jgi:hypothetical protein
VVWARFSSHAIRGCPPLPAAAHCSPAQKHVLGYTLMNCVARLPRCTHMLFLVRDRGVLEWQGCVALIVWLRLTTSAPGAVFRWGLLPEYCKIVWRGYTLMMCEELCFNYK